MAEPKTRLTGASVAAYLARIANGDLRKDCKVLVRIMQKAAGAKPRMWGATIVGFGTYTLQYASGRTAEWPLIAFAARKQNVTLYLGGLRSFTALLARLGPHKKAGGCLHLKRLGDVDRATLEKLVSASVKYIRKKYD